MSEEIVEIPEEDAPLPEYLAKAATTLENDLMSLDKNFDLASFRREKLIAKIDPVINEMEISLGGDPEKLEAQSKMIDVYARLLRDCEDNSYKRASIKLREKQEQTLGNIGGSITSILQNIELRSKAMPAFKLSQEEQNNLLKQQFDSRGCAVISDHEMEDDPTKVHHLSAVLREEAEAAQDEYNSNKK